jgi:hypothetical protein
VADGDGLPAARSDSRRITAVQAARLLDTDPGPAFGDLANLAAVVTGRDRAAAGGEAGGVGPVHGGGPAEALERADDGGGDVDLAGAGAVPGAGRVGVVHVVPAFAEREQRERPQVGGAVIAAGGVGAGADEVAQRVDRPGDVLQQRNAGQAAAHSRAPSAARQLPPITQPAAAGSASEAAHRAGNAAETARIAGSASRSGA